MPEEKKITKQSCSKKFMKEFFEKGLEEKTISKNAFNKWKKTVKAIEEGEGEQKEKYKKIQEAFYTTFIKSAKKEVKKSAHPIYDMFNEIGKQKEV